MIVECKNCETKFRVNEYQIGKNGRMVCCSVCGYEWLYISDKEEIKQELRNKPVSVQISKSNIKRIVLTIIYSFTIFIVLSLFLYVEREFLIDQHIFFESIYKLFDYHNA